MIRLFTALLAAAFLAGPVQADEVKTGLVVITDLWTRATPPGATTAAGYFTMTNPGRETDTLISASSPLAEKAGLHRTEVKDGVASMEAVSDGISVLPGEVISLAPGGYHIMFIGLKEPLKEGGKVPVTLVFDKAGKVDTSLRVLAVGAGSFEAEDTTRMKMGQ